MGTEINFIDKISYYLTGLKLIHPFREEDGRVLREFIRCLGFYKKLQKFY